MLEIDHYAYQNRWRCINPLIKGSIFIGLMLLGLSCSVHIQILMIILLIPVTCYVSKISIKQYGKWLMLPMIFLLISILGLMLSFAWDNEQMIRSIQLGSLYVGLNKASLTIGWQTFWRCLSCLVVSYLFVLTTAFDQIIYIGKKLRLPSALLEMILLTYRFIFIFLDEVITIKRAQTLRFGYVSLKTSYHSFGILGSILLERVLLRYQQMTIALESKLFNGDFHI